MTYKLTLTNGGISCYVEVDKEEELTLSLLNTLIAGVDAADKEAARVNAKLRLAAQPEWKGPDRKVLDTWEETRRAAQKRWEDSYAFNPLTPTLYQSLQRDGASSVSSGYTGIAGA